MFTFDKNSQAIVNGFHFSKPLTYFYPEFHAQSCAIVERIVDHKWDLATVLITEQPLHPSLHRDPKHWHCTHVLLCSDVEMEARHRIQHHRINRKQIKKLFTEYQYPEFTHNWRWANGDIGEREIKYEIIDAIYDAQCKMLYPEIINEFRENCRYEYDANKQKLIEVSEAKFQKRWCKIQLEILLPKIKTHHQRMYPNTPVPFNRWDQRNFFQQWFFIDRGKDIAWTYGGPGPHSYRTHLDIMTQAFQCLQQDCHWQIPTYAFQHTASNEFKFIMAWHNFKTLKHNRGSTKSPQDHYLNYDNETHRLIEQ